METMPRRGGKWDVLVCQMRIFEFMVHLCGMYCQILALCVGKMNEWPIVWEGVGDRKEVRRELKEEMEHCNPTMMVLEPSTGTPIYYATIRGAKKKSLHVKVCVKGKRLDALVDIGATASFV